MELILIVLLIVIIVGLACGLIILAQKINKLTQQSAVELVKSDVVELSRSIGAAADHGRQARAFAARNAAIGAKAAE